MRTLSKRSPSGQSFGWALSEFAVVGIVAVCETVVSVGLLTKCSVGSKGIR